MNFGKLLRGDAREAEKELCRLFTPLKIREETRKAAKTKPALMPTGNHFLNAILVQIYGTGTSALLNTGAVPILISDELANHLKLKPKPTQKIFKVADGSNSSFIARLRDITVSFGDLTVCMAF